MRVNWHETCCRSFCWRYIKWTNHLFFLSSPSITISNTHIIIISSIIGIPVIIIRSFHRPLAIFSAHKISSLHQTLPSHLKSSVELLFPNTLHLHPFVPSSTVKILLLPQLDSSSSELFFGEILQPFLTDIFIKSANIIIILTSI